MRGGGEVQPVGGCGVGEWSPACLWCDDGAGGKYVNHAAAACQYYKYRTVSSLASIKFVIH